MTNKFYAVKEGRIPGIYETWEECKAQVIGYSGAVYKSFKTKQEAGEFVGTLQAENSENQESVPDKLSDLGSDTVVAYVDGSYNGSENAFSYGMVILEHGNEHKYSKKIIDQDLAAMNNVAGEIKGAEAAMEYALKNGYKRIIIYHDYEGIAKWCLGEWKTNKEGTRAYKAFYDSIKDEIRIEFVKVTGHSGDKYNDMADELAKQALGIGG